KKPFSPEFTIYNGENEEVTLADYKGKKVILNFWASWCPPCVFEMPEFQALHDVLDPEETVLLAVNLTDGQRETKALADKFIEENDLTLNVLYDTTGSAFYEFKVSSIPQTFIIDEEGIVQYAIMGMTDKKTLDSILERME
uniref:peroxiredoxin family protein n=1 Tax=Proteiniclasticum ruminis TaxID=398199 RepID=UPI002897B741